MRSLWLPDDYILTFVCFGLAFSLFFQANAQAAEPVSEPCFPSSSLNFTDRDPHAQFALISQNTLHILFMVPLI